MYNRQLVVITHELIFVVRAAHRWGEMLCNRTIGWRHPFVVGWSKYRLGNASVAMYSGPTQQWIIYTPFLKDTDSPFAQP